LPWALDNRLDTAVNRDVIAYLRRAQPSAHSDVAARLIDAIAGLSGAYWSCPDVQAYAYVAVCTPQHGIFGLAHGLSGLALRLARGEHARAIAEGARPLPEIGEDWLAVPDGQGFDLRVWCRLAAGHLGRLAQGQPRAAVPPERAP